MIIFFFFTYFKRLTNQIFTKNRSPSPNRCVVSIAFFYGQRGLTHLDSIGFLEILSRILGSHAASADVIIGIRYVRFFAANTETVVVGAAEVIAVAVAVAY